MVNPFDPKTVFLARHAQHVVLIHFPIALFISAVAFDCFAQWARRLDLAAVAYYNFLLATISTQPVLATGVLAWQFALEGQKLHGLLLLHLVLACISTMFIWLAWWFHRSARQREEMVSMYCVGMECLGVMVIGLTGHVGGFLSGVNGLGS